MGPKNGQKCVTFFCAFFKNVFLKFSGRRFLGEIYKSVTNICTFVTLLKKNVTGSSPHIYWVFCNFVTFLHFFSILLIINI